MDKKFPFKYYLVGGKVRDQLLGIPTRDADYVVVGSTPSELKQAGLIQVGKSFPVFKDPNSSDEYALARKEVKTGTGHQAFEFDFNPQVTLEEDLYRRDFTVNALCLDNNGTIIDLFNGKKDLEKKILRHISKHFVEDPLRVFRAAKFCARLNFNIAPETMQLMKEMVKSGEVLNLSMERIKPEFEDAMISKNFGQFAKVLEDLNLWQTYHKDFPNFDVFNQIDKLDHQWAICGALSCADNFEQLKSWQTKYKISNAVFSLAKNLQQFLNWDDKEQVQTLKILSNFQDGKDKIGITSFSHLLQAVLKVQDVNAKWSKLQKLFAHFATLDLSKCKGPKEINQKRVEHLLRPAK